MKLEARETNLEGVELVIRVLGWTAEARMDFLRTIMFSRPILVYEYGQELIAILGLVPPTLMSDTAYLWFISTPELKSHKVAVGRAAQKWMKYFRSIYPRIVGHCETADAMRWLQTLGAEFVRQDGRFSFFEIIT